MSSSDIQSKRITGTGSLGVGPARITQIQVLTTTGSPRVTVTNGNGGETVLAPGDVFAVPPGIERSLQVAMSGEASLFRVSDTDDEAGPTMNFVADSRQSH